MTSVPRAAVTMSYLGSRVCPAKEVGVGGLDVGTGRRSPASRRMA